MVSYVRPIPFKATHPGSVLKDELAYRGIKQKEFAIAIGMQPSNFNEVIKGKRPISKELAIKIGEQLGMPGSIWLNLQHNYEEDLLRIAERDNKEQVALQKEKAWEELFNLKEIYKRLNISTFTVIRRVEEVLNCLGRSPLDMNLSASYFKRTMIQESAEREKGIRTWQLIVLMRAKIMTPPTQAFIRGNEDIAAQQIATLSREGQCTLAKLREILATSGILFIEEPHLPHCPVDAFSTWNEDRPLIAVTKRYNDMDKLAFDLLHELGHIHLHITETTTVGYIQVDNEYNHEHPEEQEANKYASNHLIAPSIWQKILIPQEPLNSISHHKLIEIIAKNAQLYGIAPSIAVARYKKENHFYRSNRYSSPKIN